MVVKQLNGVATSVGKHNIGRSATEREMCKREGKKAELFSKEGMTPELVAYS